MRVVVPYATLAPETRAALEADGIDAEYVFVGGEGTAYHDLMERTWRDGAPFAVVEQDIVVRPGLIAEFEACGAQWCVAPYYKGDALITALGCVRFGSELVASGMGVWDAVNSLPFDGTARRYWGRLDTRLRVVLEQRYGLAMHVHWPTVAHLNPDAPGAADRWT